MEPTESQLNISSPPYAGFWLRLVAHIIDHFVLAFALGGITVFVGLAMGVSAAVFDDMDNPANQILIITLSSILGIIFLTVTWVYSAFMESSQYQGTLGKIALSLKVTDLEGNPVSFAQATGRFFGKFLSSFIFNIGYLMIAFTGKKQGLHDILSNCLVLRK